MVQMYVYLFPRQVRVADIETDQYAQLRRGRWMNLRIRFDINRRLVGTCLSSTVKLTSVLGGDVGRWNGSVGGPR